MHENNGNNVGNQNYVIYSFLIRNPLTPHQILPYRSIGSFDASVSITAREVHVKSLQYFANHVVNDCLLRALDIYSRIMYFRSL